MNPIFNTKNMFYDYFPHLPAMRMRNDFGMGFYEQGVIRNEIQKAVRQAYDRLVVSHDLMHVNVYGEIGEEFDESFYRELKDNLHHHFHETNSWAFLDDLMKKNVIEDETESANFNTRMLAALDFGLQRTGSGRGRVNLKDALIALLNRDLDVLNGRELLYLTKIK
jgi:hypothetical protein